MRLPYSLRIDSSQVVSIYLDVRVARGDGKDENGKEILLPVTPGAPLDRENDSTVGCMTSKN